MRRVGLVAGAGVVVLAGLAACASDDGAPGAGSASTPPAAPTSGTPTASPAASGTETTEPGSVLRLGDDATVVWRASADVEGVLELRVDAVRVADRADFAGLVAAGAVEGARPYYVDVTVANVGATDLGGIAVPLYLRDTSGALGPPWGFGETFAPCRSRPLPDVFAPGQSRRKCLVYFARAGAAYDAVAFQPTPDREAITWTGEATEGEWERR